MVTLGYQTILAGIVSATLVSLVSGVGSWILHVVVHMLCVVIPVRDQNKQNKFKMILQHVGWCSHRSINLRPEPGLAVIWKWGGLLICHLSKVDGGFHAGPRLMMVVYIIGLGRTSHMFRRAMSGDNNEIRYVFPTCGNTYHVPIRRDTRIIDGDMYHWQSQWVERILKDYQTSHGIGLSALFVGKSGIGKSRFVDYLVREHIDRFKTNAQVLEWDPTICGVDGLDSWFEQSGEPHADNVLYILANEYDNAVYTAEGLTKKKDGNSDAVTEADNQTRLTSVLDRIKFKKHVILIATSNDEKLLRPKMWDENKDVDYYARIYRYVNDSRFKWNSILTPPLLEN